MILFTIAICTYNGERTLELAINSILRLKRFHELVGEVLLIDNASTDNTCQICHKYCNSNSKFKYIYEPKSGLANARKRAVDTAYDWVVYVDDDNILDENWLVTLKSIIENNKSVGVVNGAVVAKPACELNNIEKIILELNYRNLACTHLYSIESSAPANTEPMGAGLCIKTEALRIIRDNGWLKLQGRKGKQLSSGEDTELSHKVLDLGYDYISSYKMFLDHIIPPNRLKKEYIENLLKGLISGRFFYLLQSKHGRLKTIIRVPKYFILFVSCLILKPFLGDDIFKIEVNRERYIVSKQYIYLFFKSALGGEIYDA